MYDIAAIGELLIDFAPGGETKEGIALFEQNSGGAPANVLAMASRLGKKTAMIGKVHGDDAFGRFLVEVLQDIRVETKGLIYTKEANTTLAFVSLDPNGDWSFCFYRNPGADMLLRPSEVDPELVGDCRIFHFEYMIVFLNAIHNVSSLKSRINCVSPMNFIELPYEFQSVKLKISPDKVGTI